MRPGSSNDGLSDSGLCEVSPTDLETKCKMCLRPAQDPSSGLNLGPLYKFGKCQAHLYCLMFSSSLVQMGEEEEDIKGFLVKDILKEWRRGSYLKCSYCKQTYATVGCVAKGCRKTFHLPCGIENGSLQQFFGKFPSFCPLHRPVQTPSKVRVGGGGGECGVCLDELEEVPGSDVLWTPCCGGWFHRNCVERMAETAGCHFFKCPLCNNKDEFSQEMQDFGIYLPDQDAGWETGSAYDDQLERHGTCDAVPCICPEGRDHDEDDTIWEIVLCSCCGAQGVHVKCGDLKPVKPKWKCSLCKDVVTRIDNKPVSVFTRVKRGKGSTQFQKSILDNVRFHVNNNPFFRKNEVNVSVYRNRNDDEDAAIASFTVHPVPVIDVPLPVKVRRKDMKVEAETETPPYKKIGLDSFENIFNNGKPSLIVGSSPLPKMINRSKSSNPLSLADHEMLIPSPELEGMRSDKTSTPPLQRSLKICTSTPLADNNNKKKRRLSLPPSSTAQVDQHEVITPPGQSSILNFFHYTSKSKDDVKPCNNTLQINKSQAEEVERSSSVKDEQFSCSLCPNSKFKAKKSWKAHIVNIHKDLDVKIIDSRQVLKLGLEDSLLQCGKCDQVFKTEILVKAHLETDHTEHSVQTGVEGETEMKTPEAIAKDNKKLKCDSCEKTYTNTGNLVKHFVSQHSHKPSPNQALHLECYICKEPVIFGDDYECHLNVAHNFTEDESSLNNEDQSQNTYDMESDVITLEDSILASESEEEITCGLCADPVMIGDDYRCHLRFYHDISEEEIEKMVSKSGYSTK